MSSPENTEVLLQVRTLIMQVMEKYALYEAYPDVDPNELLCSWEDVVDEERMAQYLEPVFSINEQEHIATFQRNWEALCNNTPESLGSPTELLSSTHWQPLSEAASEGFQAFKSRKVEG